MSKRKSGKARARRELREEYLPGGDKKSLRIEDLDLKAAGKRADEFDRTVIKPNKIQQQEEVVDTFDEILSTQDEIMKLFNPERLNLQVIYKRKRLDFKIRPIDSTDDLGAISMDLSVYGDLSELEISIMDKGFSDKKLSSTEQKLYDNTVEKLKTKIAGTILDQVNYVLVTFVSPPEGTEEERRKFWNIIPFDLKTFIASEVMDRLGISPESDVKLFQVD
jgi:hypothetical protein